MRSRLLSVLLLAATLMSCAPKQNFTVVFEDPTFRQLDFSQSTIAVVPPTGGLEFSREAISVVDNPAGRAQQHMDTLRDCFHGDFEFYRALEGGVRAHCRRNIQYVEAPDDLDTMRDAVMFAEGQYGILTATIVDAGALLGLSRERLWDYVLFLEDLTLDQYFTDAYEPVTATLRTKADLKLVSQVFLVCPSTGKVLYHGYVTGEANESLYGYRMELSFVGHLLRGPLRLR